MTLTPVFSPFQALAAKWHIFARFAVALVRLMRRYENGGVHGAGPYAAELETCLRTGHILLLQELADTLEACQPQTEADAHGLQHVQFIACALLAALSVICRVRRRLCGARCWQSAGVVGAMQAHIAQATFPARETPHLDSS